MVYWFIPKYVLQLTTGELLAKIFGGSNSTLGTVGLRSPTFSTHFNPPGSNLIKSHDISVHVSMGPIGMQPRLEENPHEE